ncbi:DUF6660 family protein [Chitinophaga sp. XS-30]|uniref:DUF6660 family protein n=1 Tax=Chitinophaga sp. XS-30 TaxID=2604421 RepID=UPI0011DCF42C|nr:DUF6660 family protein [Chitinophaga sp. XS-30]QEH42127.1 hypothetical protein FW415_15100 [Chitinophaga sp. XS-30]
MKVLSLFLSIWILFCSGVPCTDRQSACDNAGGEIHTGLADHEDFDHCSPFCICSCCAVTTALPKAVSFFHRQAVLPVIPEIFICPPVSDYANACWQPPRQA